MTIAAVECLETSLAIRWADGGVSRYPYLFLRDNDPGGFHPQTREREFDLLSIDETLRPRAVAVEADAVVVDWSDPTAGRSSLPVTWLADHRPGQRAPDPADIPAETWDAAFIARLPRFAADDLLTDDAVLIDWLATTKRFGLTLVTGVADHEDAGIAIGERIGFLRRTNFGLTFRVETLPDPNNLAYTSHALPLHTDLPNQELPPGFQFLHCVRNGAEGGHSTFADGFHIAEVMQAGDPDGFALLSSVAVPYRFHDRDYDIRVHRPVISVDERGRVYDIRYSAHIMAAFDMEADLMVRYYAAFRRLMALTRDPRFTLDFKLQPGEMVAFDNRRALHGRTAFNPATGHRLLKGYYVDRGEFDSRIRVLARLRDG